MNTTFKKSMIALSLAVATLVASQALAFTESESNNTFATANLIVRGAAPWSDVGVLSLSPAGDVDYFKIHLDAGETLTAITTPLRVPFTSPDTMIALFDPSQTERAFNDDAGSGFGSAIRFTADTSGDWFIAVTGYYDRDFSGGDHSEAGRYTLTTSIVPEPAGLIALSTGLVSLLARRRKKA